MPQAPDEQPLQPGTITRLVAQKRDPQRVSVYLDGAFAFGVHQDVLVQFMLRKGQVLSVEQQQEILAAEDLGKAKQVAMQYLAYKPRTEREVRRKLARKDFSERVVDRVVERLHELDYLDDAAYARQYARGRFETGGYGPERIRRDLLRRGIDRHTAETTVAELATEADTVGRAREQAERRWPRLQREPDLRKRKKKLADFLLRRGFTYDTVFQVVDEVLAREST